MVNRALIYDNDQRSMTHDPCMSLGNERTSMGDGDERCIKPAEGGV